MLEVDHIDLHYGAAIALRQGDRVSTGAAESVSLCCAADTLGITPTRKDRDVVHSQSLWP